jgi:hypothetical protein
MKLQVVLFSLVLVLGAVVGGSFFISPPENAAGGTHLKFTKAMNEGGDARARHEGKLIVGWIFGLAQVALFTGLLALGARKRGQLGRFKTPIAIGGAAYAAVWTLLVVTYRSYMLGENQELYLSFPAPTAVMLYGIWLVPIFFVVVYLLYFDRVYFTKEDAERFEQILEAKRRRERREDAA